MFGQNFGQGACHMQSVSLSYVFVFVCVCNFGQGACHMRSASLSYVFGQLVCVCVILVRGRVTCKVLPFLIYKLQDLVDIFIGVIIPFNTLGYFLSSLFWIQINNVVYAC